MPVIVSCQKKPLAARLPELQKFLSPEQFKLLTEQWGTTDTALYSAEFNTKWVGAALIQGNRCLFFEIHPATWRRGVGKRLLEIIRQQRGSFNPVFYHAKLDENAQAFANTMGILGNADQSQWQLN